MPLTNKQIEAAKPRAKTYRLADGNSLYLEVKPSGRKSWRIRFRNPQTKQHNIYTIGDYPRVTIREARAALLAAKDRISQGKHPNPKAHGRSDDSFAAVAREWHSKRAKRWREATKVQHLQSLERDIFPYIGNTPITDLTAPDLLQVIRKVEARGKLDKANKVKQRLGAVFSYAVASGIVKYNPVPDLAAAMEATPRGRHFKALESHDLPAFLHDLQAYPSEILRRAVLFTLLTFARTESVRYAEWAEIDWQGKQWVIPRAHLKVKTRTDHTIPLSTHALEVLAELRELTGNGRLLFWTVQEDKPMSENAMLQVLKRIGWKDKTTIHGFRALASSVLHDAGFPPHIIERQLAHVDKNRVAGAYNYKAEYLPERVRIMQWWSDYVMNATQPHSATPDNVITLFKRESA